MSKRKHHLIIEATREIVDFIESHKRGVSDGKFIYDEGFKVCVGEPLRVIRHVESEAFGEGHELMDEDGMHFIIPDSIVDSSLFQAVPDPEPEEKAVLPNEQEVAKKNVLQLLREDIAHHFAESLQTFNIKETDYKCGYHQGEFNAYRKVLHIIDEAIIIKPKYYEHVTMGRAGMPNSLQEREPELRLR